MGSAQAKPAAPAGMSPAAAAAVGVGGPMNPKSSASGQPAPCSAMREANGMGARVDSRGRSYYTLASIPYTAISHTQHPETLNSECSNPKPYTPNPRP